MRQSKTERKTRDMGRERKRSTSKKGGKKAGRFRYSLLEIRRERLIEK